MRVLVIYKIIEEKQNSLERTKTKEDFNFYSLIYFRVLYLLCIMALRLRSSGQKTLGEVTFVARLSFSPGLLPTKKEVLEVMIFHLLPSPGKPQRSSGRGSQGALGLPKYLYCTKGKKAAYEMEISM